MVETQLDESSERAVEYILFTQGCTQITKSIFFREKIDLSMLSMLLMC